MSTETEAEGEILMKFLAALGGALGAVANDPVANAVPPEVGDTLDDVVRGFQHGERAVRQALVAVDVADPYVAQAEKIIAEVMASYQALGTELSAWWSTWLTDQRADLAQRQEAQQPERKRGVGR